jgi:MoxR-like ATPase
MRDGKSRTRNCARCKAEGFVWGKIDGNWRLFPARQEDGLYFPDMAQAPHGCAAKPPKWSEGQTERYSAPPVSQEGNYRDDSEDHGHVPVPEGGRPQDDDFRNGPKDSDPSPAAQLAAAAKAEQDKAEQERRDKAEQEARGAEGPDTVEDGSYGEGDGEREDDGEGDEEGEGEGEGEGAPEDSEPSPVSEELARAIARAVLPYLQDPIKATAEGAASKLALAIGQQAIELAAKAAQQAVDKMPRTPAQPIEPAEGERILIVERASGAKTEAIKGGHPKLDELVRLLLQGENAYLYGPPGSGKTTGAAQAAKALGLAYGYISLNPQTADSRLVGFLDAQGRFTEPLFYKLYTEGGVFCIDEMDNASGSMLTALNGALENGHAAFPNGMAAKHEDFRLVGTGNTPGMGPMPGHPERRAWDSATPERFAFVYWPYDEALEQKLTLAANPGAKSWLQWVRKVRKYAKDRHIGLVVSPRASIKGAKLAKAGIYRTAEDLADAVLFKWRIDPGTREAILAACPLPTVTIVQPDKADSEPVEKGGVA